MEKYSVNMYIYIYIVYQSKHFHHVTDIPHYLYLYIGTWKVRVRCVCTIFILHISRESQEKNSNVIRLRT